jgi:hypothetical protein
MLSKSKSRSGTVVVENATVEDPEEEEDTSFFISRYVSFPGKTLSLNTDTDWVD